MTRALPDILGAIRLALFPPDPGSFRLIGATRATLGGLLALGLAVAAEAVMPMAFTARVLAFGVALFLGALVRDPTRGQQAVTMALAPLPVFATAVLVALALPVPYMADLLTVALVFAAICAASCGPRWAALGAVSLIALLIALLSHLTIADLPSRLLVILLAAASAALVRFAILPDRPGAELRRLRLGVRNGLLGLLDEITAALQRGGWGRLGRRRLRRAVARMNESAMLAQPRLAPEPALQLLELDLLAERVARVALLDLGTAAERPALLALLAALRRAVQDGTTPAIPSPEGQRGRLGAVLAGLAPLLAWSSSDAPAPPPAPTPSHFRWATLEVRPAIQAALAAALAIVGGELVAPSRWYWAVFAAFAVFQGTRSRGESVAKAVQMLAGTLAGVLGGVLLATLLAGHVWLTMAAISGGLFLAFFASTAAYGVMIFWITVILGLVFGMLGYFPPSLLLVRLQETAVGAGAGSVVAWLVLARPTPNLVRRCAADFLHALADVVSAAARPLLGRPVDDHISDLTLALEQRYQTLLTAAGPRLPGTRLLGAEQARRLMLLLAACDRWARELVRTSLHLPPSPGPALEAAATQATTRIADSIGALIAFLNHQPTRGGIPHDEPHVLPVVADSDDPAAVAARLLLRLDGALLHMRQRLGA